MSLQAAGLPAADADEKHPSLIAVVGNPNTGKTTLFNALTGLSQRVGNYAGVTVEWKRGRAVVPGSGPVELLDLPGTYAIEGRSPDERIVTEVLRHRHAEVPRLSGVLVVVDACHLRRNMRLVAEVLSTGLPAAIALNMVDLAAVEGIRIDAARLSERLGIPVTPVCATRRIGLAGLVSGFARMAIPRAAPGDDLGSWIDLVMEGVVEQPEGLRESLSDRVDRLLVHPLWGALAFAAVMALIFQSIFSGAAPLMDAIDAAVAAAGGAVGKVLPEGHLRSLVVDGAVAGVGSVVIFLPQIALLFLAIALLEDCGYMPRAALLMDRIMRWCGLSGRSFIPMLCSFACAVPGIMATRTIEDRRDRLATILVAPLMSCSARLPVYTLFIAAFVPSTKVLGGWVGLQALTMTGLYVLGVAVAIPVARLLKGSVLRGTSPPFLMELPSYKVPDARTVLMRVYHACVAFLRRAGSVIFAASVAMWAMATFPTSPGTDASTALANSVLGRAGRWIEPAVRPLGWDWRIAVATLSAFPAREIVVSSLGTIYSVESEEPQGESLKAALQSARKDDGSAAFSLPVVLSVLVFFALCAQCASTLAVIRREAGGWGWAVFSFTYMTALAYTGAWIAYHVSARLM